MSYPEKSKKQNDVIDAFDAIDAKWQDANVMQITHNQATMSENVNNVNSVTLKLLIVARMEPPHFMLFVGTPGEKNAQNTPGYPLAQNSATPSHKNVREMHDVGS